MKIHLLGIWKKPFGLSAGQKNMFPPGEVTVGTTLVVVTVGTVVVGIIVVVVGIIVVVVGTAVVVLTAVEGATVVVVL